MSASAISKAVITTKVEGTVERIVSCDASACPGELSIMMDRLREKFGPNYTYRDGDEYCLPVDELLGFHDEDFNQPVEQVNVHTKKHKVHHLFVGAFSVDSSHHKAVPQAGFL